MLSFGIKLLKKAIDVSGIIEDHCNKGQTVILVPAPPFLSVLEMTQRKEKEKKKILHPETNT